MFIQVFPVGSQQIEDRQKQVCNPMLTTIETTLSQHVWDVALFFQKGSSAFHVSAEEYICLRSDEVLSKYRHKGKIWLHLDCP